MKKPLLAIIGLALMTAGSSKTDETDTSQTDPKKGPDTFPGGPGN